MSDKTAFDLKEKAKWSTDPEEKKTAIRELMTYGESAIPQLEEILNVTAYEDIRAACVKAIKDIVASSKERGEITIDESNLETTSTIKGTKSQKKEEESGAAGGEVRLADLPP